MRNLVRILLVFLLSGLFSQSCFADATQQKGLLQQANNAYHERDYDLAVKIYEQLINENGYSAGILYNLANTYAQKGETGRAIVNYQRARLLAPGDPDIKGNLEVVNKKAGLFDDEQPLFNKLTTIISFNQWCDIGLFSFAVLIGSAAAALFLSGWKALSRTAVPISFFTMIISSYLAFVSYHPYTSGVIIQPETTLLISPHDKASTNGSIREGRQVHLLKEYNNFRYVKDWSGRTGWVPKQSVEAIIPAGMQ